AMSLTAHIGIFLTVMLSYPTTLLVESYYEDQCIKCCRGLRGQEGSSGLPSPNGEREHFGHTTVKGEKGDKGEMGLRGLPGEKGDIGPAGPKGSRGKKGTKGECGLPGPAGDKGDMGLKGPIGKQSQGARGPKGDQPSRIAFTVTRSEPLGPVPQKTPVTFDKIHLNLGDSFDVYSSHFICKVNGTYLFTVHMLSMENHTAYGWIMLNNDHQMAFHGDAQARHGTGSNTIILRLSRDDHVWVQLNENSAVLNHFSSFSGHILFED
ncbi:unnamed protein product, partial [Candidula unifasciata]